MFTKLPQTERAILTLVVFVAAYFGTLTIGRILKRRAGVSLGIAFQLLCITIAFYVALGFYGIVVSWRSHVDALAILLVTSFFVALLNRYLWDAYFEKKCQKTIPHFLRQVVALFIYLIALLVILSVVYHAEGQLQALLAGSGVAAIVLGFATQDLLGGIIAGIALQINRPYQVGDWLKMEDQFAEVMEINWRSTRLRTNDGIYLDIPNYTIARGTIINLHYPTHVHAMRLQMPVDYEIPPNRAKDALLHATENADGVLKDPRPKVFVTGFADSDVSYEIKFWMENHAAYNDICDAIRTNIWYEFKRRHIPIPFPQRTLHIVHEKPKSPLEGLAEARLILRGDRLFDCLEDAQLDNLLRGSQIHHYGRGERVIEEGSKGDSMFVVLNGKVHVSVMRNGNAVRLGEMRKGDCFGEMSLLTGEPRSATIRAQVDSDVLEISKEAMAEVMRNTPEAVNRLSEILAERKLEGEGILKDMAQREGSSSKEREYQATFLRRLRTVFEL